jgi:hypothetical protein
MWVDHRPHPDRDEGDAANDRDGTGYPVSHQVPWQGATA